jgi:hypothetical protein
MLGSRHCFIGGCLALSIAASELYGGGLIPDRVNKVMIEGRFSNPEQGFLLLFSAQPPENEQGRPLRRLTEKQIKSFASGRDEVLIKVYGKRQTKPGRFEFHFGPGVDATQPWNDGRDFAWAKWAELSPDIWDNVCIVAPVPPGNRTGSATISNVEIVKGGKLLYDSRKRESYPNEQRVLNGFPPFNGASRQGNYPVLHLGERMADFRREFYETGDNPLLNTAYADLGQTEKSKYARRGNNWCSEFASWVYRSNGIMTPDPNRSDVHFRSMREFFAQHGHVYPMREVVGWSDAEKVKRIKPGSFVSILLGSHTHSLLFTTWVRNGREPITSYTGVSGNNKGMVWAHAPLKLPTEATWGSMSPDQLAVYDEKVYFAVPSGSQ